MDIKSEIKKNKLFQWQVAEFMGIGEVTLVRWLRRPEKLDEEKRTKIEAAIRSLSKKEK